MLLLLKYQDTTTCVMFRNDTSNVDEEGKKSLHYLNNDSFSFSVQFFEETLFHFHEKYLVPRTKKSRQKMTGNRQKEKDIYRLTAMKYQCRSQLLQRTTKKNNLLGLKKLWIGLGFRSYQDDQRNYSPTVLAVVEEANFETDCSRN